MPTTKLTSSGLQYYDDSGNLISFLAFDSSTGDLVHDKQIQATQFVSADPVVVIGPGGTGGAVIGTVIVAGSGYQANDTGAVVAKTGSGSGATFLVGSVDANSGVAVFLFATNGTDYAPLDEVYLGDAQHQGTLAEARVDAIT
jgi:hypothetical protein